MRQLLRNRQRQDNRPNRDSSNDTLPIRDAYDGKSKDSWWKRTNWKFVLQSGQEATYFWILFLCMVLLLCVYDVLSRYHEFSSAMHHQSKIHPKTNVSILFETESWSSVPYPTGEIRHSPEKSYGGLDFHHRKIRFDDPIPINPEDAVENEKRLKEKFNQKLQEDSDADQPESSKLDLNPTCRPISWTTESFPNCNHLHEWTIERIDKEQGYEVSYLRSGSYRDAYRIQNSLNRSDEVVMKRAILADLEIEDIADIHKEAIILERMSSSPHVLNIYGFCGTSVFVEAMAGDIHTDIVKGIGFASQTELDKLDDVKSFNNFTSSEKLQISLDMADSLADLHGFYGGPIIHADTHIEQWLVAPDRSIRLNDFNNARLPTWNSKKGRYCERHGTYGGVWRSPEEFSGGTQNESIDVFAFGNNIYTLITGLWPFYDDEYKEVSHRRVRKKIIAGDRPFVDPRFEERSFIEKGLIDIMKKCWSQNRSDRPPIFEIIIMLNELKSEAEKRGELEKYSRIRIPMGTFRF